MHMQKHRRRIELVKLLCYGHPTVSLDVHMHVRTYVRTYKHLYILVKLRPMEWLDILSAV